jgi:hypothetical protein
MVMGFICPLDTTHGDTVCRDGVLWALTYGECAPPDQRQVVDECPHCKRHRADRLARDAIEGREPEQFGYATPEEHASAERSSLDVADQLPCDVERR